MAPNTVYGQLFAKLIGEKLDTSKVQQFARIKETFTIFDKDNNGFITYEDVGKVLMSLGQNPTEDELKGAIADLDADGNRVIDFQEFFNFMSPKIKDEDSEEDLKEAFKMIDKDEDGFISAAKLREVTTALGEDLTDEEANAMVEKADLDCDGKVSYEEFKKIVGE